MERISNYLFISYLSNKRYITKCIEKYYNQDITDKKHYNMSVLVIENFIAKFYNMT